MKKWATILLLLVIHLHATDNASDDSFSRPQASSTTVAELGLMRDELKKDIEAELALERILEKIQDELSMAFNKTNRTND